MIHLKYRYQSGSDGIFITIIKGTLEIEDITSIAQAHRKMRDSFINDPSIEAINTKINQDTSLTDKKIALSVELVTKNAWENSLVTQLDEIPFYYVGKGEQCVIKTELALAKQNIKKCKYYFIGRTRKSFITYTIKSIDQMYFETICRKTNSYFNT